MMESCPDPEYKKELFVNDNNSPIQFEDNFKVKWIVTCEYPFRNLEYLPPNPMNENMPIKNSKNGQELTFKLGNYLCHLIYNFSDPSKKILVPLDKYKSTKYYYQRSEMSSYQERLQPPLSSSMVPTGISSALVKKRENNGRTGAGGSNAMGGGNRS